MKITIRPKNLDLLKSQERLIDRHADKVKRMLLTFSQDSVDLDISLEKLPRGSQFQASLVLALPQRTFKVEDIQDNPTSSLVNAFLELRRRVKRFKSQLTRERLWRKQPAPAPAALPRTMPWEIETEANDHLEKVENYLRREIYHQVLLGTMPPGILEAQALADEVFVETTSNQGFKPDGLSVEQWMFRLARRALRDRLDELEKHREERHIEEEAHPQDQWEDEELNFYQPDESLHLEDLLLDKKSSNPEEILAREETETRLHRSVASLPASLRESFVLFVMEGFTSDEVAMLTGKDPAGVLEEVEEAREVLRQELLS